MADYTDNQLRSFLSLGEEPEPKTSDQMKKEFFEEREIFFKNLCEVGAGAIPEMDPTGRSPKDSGAKLDMGKPRVGLVLLGFSRALMEVAKVGTYGAEKYTDGGWVDVPDGEARYTDAMFRHLLAESDSTHDEGSGLLHAAHTAWCALCRLEFQLRRQS